MEVGKQHSAKACRAENVELWKTEKVGLCGRNRKNKNDHGVHGDLKVKTGPDHVISFLEILSHKRPVKYFKKKNNLFKRVF